MIQKQPNYRQFGKVIGEVRDVLKNKPSIIPAPPSSDSHAPRLGRRRRRETEGIQVWGTEEEGIRREWKGRSGWELHRLGSDFRASLVSGHGAGGSEVDDDEGGSESWAVCLIRMGHLWWAFSFYNVIALIELFIKIKRKIFFDIISRERGIITVKGI